ncbi:hypothetical protein SLA2020_314440 [Shorea laevis]
MTLARERRHHHALLLSLPPPTNSYTPLQSPYPRRNDITGHRQPRCTGETRRSRPRKWWHCLRSPPREERVGLRSQSPSFRRQRCHHPPPGSSRGGDP